MSEEASKLPKDIAAAEGKVNVQINGTWHRFPRGTRIADACRSVGVPIPCFCYHPQAGCRRLLPHVHGGTGDAAQARSGTDTIL